VGKGQCSLDGARTRVAWDVSVRRGVVTIIGPQGAEEHDVAERVARTVPGVRHVVVDDT
jgi:osmotically-inducible protein OsmY